MFSKYHALGNDYLVLPSDSKVLLTADRIARLCDRHYGIGGDGVLIGPLASFTADFRLCIFNPDGSEAEKSGNGLRIFCRYLWDQGLVGSQPFNVETSGGVVRAQTLDAGHAVRVEMGRVSFNSIDVPLTGEPREVLRESVLVNGRAFEFSAASIGNPHCVIVVNETSAGLAREFGPLFERLDLFPRRTNVQFVQVLNQQAIRIEIWERGAGYTLASGSSSCAAAAVAYRLGLCDSSVDVRMPGGEIRIDLNAAFEAVMTGAVTRICSGDIAAECFDWKI